MEDISLEDDLDFEFEAEDCIYTVVVSFYDENNNELDFCANIGSFTDPDKAVQHCKEVVTKDYITNLFEMPNATKTIFVEVVEAFEADNEWIQDGTIYRDSYNV